MENAALGLVDIGANLTHSSFEHDFLAVIAEAQSAGVQHILLTGTDLETSQASFDFAQRDPQLFSSTAGFHPHVAQQVTAGHLAAIEKLVAQDKVVAVGETGLDFNRNFSEPDSQLTVFEAHLQIASRVSKPLFLHQREAHKPFFERLSAYRDELAGGVVHCFTDSRSALRDYLDLDMYIGITGWVCDERRGKDLQDIVSFIPQEKLLIETDAPYLLPRTLRPKPKTRRNEPKYLTEVLRVLAECRSEDVSKLAAATASNARRLFALPCPSVPA